MKVRFRSIVLAFPLLVNFSAWSDPKILLAQPSLGIYSSILGSSIEYAKTGISVVGLGSGANSNGASAFGISGAFALGSADELNKSGWAVGFGTGITSLEDAPDKFLSPSTYFWELMLGRGTLFAPGADKTGLYGFIEFAVRDERPRRDPTLTAALALMDASLQEHSRSFILRIGAAKSFDGVGLVDQKAGTLGYRFNLNLYLPLLSAAPSLIQPQALFFLGCAGSFLHCGLAVDYTLNRNASRGGVSEDVESAASLGPFVKWRFSGKYIWQLGFNWIGIASRHHFILAPAPQVRTAITATF